MVDLKFLPNVQLIHGEKEDRIQTDGLSPLDGANCSFLLSTDAEYREMALKLNEHYRVLNIAGDSFGICLISVKEAYRQKRDNVDTVPLDSILEVLAPEDRAYVVGQ